MKISFMSKLIDDLDFEIRCAHTTKAEETPLLLCEHSFSVPIFGYVTQMMKNCGCWGCFLLVVVLFCNFF